MVKLGKISQPKIDASFPHDQVSIVTFNLSRAKMSRKGRLVNVDNINQNMKNCRYDGKYRDVTPPSFFSVLTQG